MSVRNPIRERIHHAPFSRLQAVTDCLPALVSYVDSTQRYRFSNRRHEVWFGHGRDGIRGMHMREVLGAEIYESVRPAVERALSGETVHFEMKLPFRDEGVRDVELRYVPDEQGSEVLGFVAIIEDVTERRRAEEALRNADRRKDEFLATLAHELRNPLAPIRNAVQVLQLAEGDRGMAATARSMIERQLKQLVRLIDDLLDVSRITQGQIELRREPVDLAAILQLALETTRPLLETRQHRVHVIWPQEPLCVDGDPTRLAQVFANLLHNSAKYSDAGGQITIAAMRDGAQALVKVADSGAGIASDMLPRVFDMFTRATRSVTGGQDGLGIGLTLVKRLVELHGGTVEAQSEGLGKGSVFSVRLGLAQAPSPSSLPGAAGERVTMSGEGAVGGRVLVVDDNHDAAASLALMLDLNGYEIRTASDGIEALEIAETFRPEFVVLDIGMPRLDGYQTAREIRARPWGKSVTLLALTGWGQEEDKRRALEAGFDYHLTKPVDPQLLQRLLEQPARQEAWVTA
ncbi:MAG: hybrid sensor histidine kinase/response regulator [Gammaproteobacteria bacterium]